MSQMVACLFHPRTTQRLRGESDIEQKKNKTKALATIIEEFFDNMEGVPCNAAGQCNILHSLKQTGY